MKLFNKIYGNKKISVSFQKHIMEGFMIGVEFKKTPLEKTNKAWWVFVRLGFHTLMIHYFEGKEGS